MAELINGLGGTAGFGENALTRNDDYYQSNVDITSLFGIQGLNFFGTTYTSIAINNNGNITFGSGGLSTYTPFGLASGGYPIIAPFFADVDTRGGVTTATAGGTSTGSNLVYYDFDTTSNVYGTLTVTWDDVGYFSSHTNKLNAFQLQLIGTGGGNFDMVFRYEDINWTTGDYSGGSNGLGGTVAKAGYSVGDGSIWYEFPQSGSQDGMLSLETVAGTGAVPGYFRFSVSGGSSTNDTVGGAENDDMLSGGAGNDTISGYAGDDILNGGTGADRMLGSTGNDSYSVDNAGDVIVEGINEGTDTVWSTITYILGANLENLYLTGSLDINGTGNTLDNVFRGNTGDNILDGGSGYDTVDYTQATYGVTVNLGLSTSQYISGQGDDTLVSIEGLTGSMYNDSLTGNSFANIINGGAGADTMIGGTGNDTYYVDNVGDVVTEALNEGTDTVYSSISYTLGANVENLILTGSAALNGTGNELDNILTGNSAINILIGGAGNDIYYVDNVGDVVTENLNEGTDTVYSSISYTLGANVENLILTGSAALNGTGNGLDNILTGNSAINILVGGAGNDIYYVDNTVDIITENSNEGADTVYSSTDYTLDDNVENLILTGSVVNGIGNDLDNSIIGNVANNTLDGGAGADAMIGGAGNDTYYVDNTNDVVIENLNEGTDTVIISFDYTIGNNIENLTLIEDAVMGTGNSLNNIITGNEEDNTLDGGAGNDSLIAGGGEDTLSYGSATAAVKVSLAVTAAQKTGSSGTDTISGFENLSGSGFNDTLTGDALENLLLGLGGNDALNGGAGDDILDGGAGADKLSGGLGDDIYYVENIGDKVTEGTGEANGSDTIYAAITLSKAINNVENFIATGTTGSENINLIGNILENTLIGNNGNNTLDGGKGNDEMSGGVGDDTYKVDSAEDTIVEQENEGTDSVLAAVNYSLADSANVENLTLTLKALVGTGNDSNNIIIGTKGLNTLDGGAGNDTLYGKEGNDLLTGGDGLDVFVFDTKLNTKSNKDTITDFISGDDTITLKSTIFTKLAIGDLSSDNFAIISGTDKAAGLDDYILLNSTTGVLSYDADGSGNGVAIEFAVLTGIGTLSVDDFAIV